METRDTSGVARRHRSHLGSPEWPTLTDLLPERGREVLECLPCEPNGVSLHELAADLVGDRGPQALHIMRTVLDGLEVLLGGLALVCRRPRRATVDGRTPSIVPPIPHRGKRPA